MVSPFEEAMARYNDPRNILGPNYVPQQERLKQEEEGGEDEDKQDDSGAADGADEPHLNTKQIDNILAGAVKGSENRAQPNLRGQIDTQVAIGGTAFILGPKKAGNLFGKSTAQTEAYAKGLSSPSDMREMKDRVPERTQRLKSVKAQLAEMAAGRLRHSLNSLTDEKIDGLNASRISAIAKDMAVVMDKVARDHDKAESVHFHIFIPERKAVADYEVVNVSGPIIDVPRD